jgi:ABC-type sugar transport system ATPase subunit
MTETLLLEAKGLGKRYPGTVALEDVRFDLRKGEVHCLVGENGAGKSTLIKILAGAVAHDEGEIRIDDVDVGHADLKRRRDLGVSVIYQDLNLVPQLTVTENIFLGHEPRTARGTIDTKLMTKRAQQLIDSLGVSFPVAARVGDLGISLQQLTATARALSLDGRILIMDEPSAVLSGKELDVLFSVIDRLKRSGIGVIYISHHLDEIFRIGDRVTVLRDGRHVGSKDVKDSSRAELIRMMVGRSLSEYDRRRTRRERGAEVLRVEGFTGGPLLKDVSFTLHAGEVLGIAGLVGSGRTELARAIVGLDAIESGSLVYLGRPMRITGPEKAVALGISLVPEDRKVEGLVSVLSVRDNAALSILEKMSRLGFVRFRSLNALIEDLRKTLAIKVPRIENRVSGLSGGNQQKVVLAKCLATGCKVLILDEPTRGIDVGAKAEIYRLIERLVSEGMAIIVISSEMPEILALSDRILVLSQGRVAAEFDGPSASQEQIMTAAVTQHSAAA